MLYIVATPIGNLEDISLRALRILGEADFVLCEDTRVTKRILDHYKIDTPTMSYHQHSDLRRTEEILALLQQGKDLALVSDAGTPGISDPGGRLVAAVVERLGGRVRVESVPGPSAVTAALSISGIPTDRFVFMGFPPHKNGRQAFLQKIKAGAFPAVVYESKHRILKFLQELEALNRDIDEHNRDIEEKKQKGYVRTKDLPERIAPITSVVVCRELSKMHETVYRGELSEIISKLKDSQNDQKGEFVVIVGR